MFMGTYKYQNGKWQRETPNFSSGVHVVYFGNNKCGACRLFDYLWELAVKRWREDNVDFWIVRCDWFDHECSDKTAKKLFREYKINASPTLIIIRDGKIIDRITGALTPKELEAWIKYTLKENKEEKKREKRSSLGYFC